MTAKEKEQQQKAITYWRESALRDRLTAKGMYGHHHYDWSLFIFHLAIEKLLKALIITLEQTPLYTHDLVRLAKQAGLELTESQREQLVEISKFNIEARYADEKLELYRRATPEFTETWHTNCEHTFQWIEELLNKSR
jgi:HEPN domain-containing protein